MNHVAPVETFQSPFELEQFVGVVERLRPKRVLEVGAWHGGTLWHWIQLSPAKVVVVDDEMRESDIWMRWAVLRGVNLHRIQGLSQATPIVDEARSHGPYDFVFIDGDHTYEAVRSDWDNYGPMVAPGGVIAFHDILPRPAYGVSRLWDELKGAAGSRYMEICQNETLAGNEGRCGVGLLWRL